MMRSLFWTQQKITFFFDWSFSSLKRRGKTDAEKEEGRMKGNCLAHIENHANDEHEMKIKTSVDEKGKHVDALSLEITM